MVLWLIRYDVGLCQKVRLQSVNLKNESPCPMLAFDQHYLLKVNATDLLPIAIYE